MYDSMYKLTKINYQYGGVVSQENKPVDIFSRKLMETKKR